jgi:diguanylate cyclase (GGDEF)-like protein/PAS domain S-box-containing protein
MSYLALNALAAAAHPSMNAASALAFLFNHTELLPNLGYWEQDEQHRIVCMLAPRSSEGALDTSVFIGRTPWDMGGEPPGGWDLVRPQFERHEPFNELVLRYRSPRGEVHHISHTLQARHDAQGGFVGYHGVFKDVTRRVAMERRVALEHQVATLLAQAGPGALMGVLQALVQALGWRRALLWRADGPGKPLRCAHRWPVEDPVPLAPLVPAGAAPGEPQQARWVPEFPDGAAEGVRCGLAIPISFDGDVLGVVEVIGEHVEQADPHILHSCVFIGTAMGQYLERARLEQERQKFHTVVESMPDMVYLVDRQTMRFAYVNEAGCAFSRFSFNEMMEMGPQDVLPNTREHFEQLYDELIANPEQATLTESISFGKGGGKAYVAVSRRALKVGDRWYSLSISRDITPRKLAERAAERSRRMYAALSDTNEAIVQSKSPQELFDRVCLAAVEGGKFLGAAVVLPQGDAGGRIVATAGPAGLRDARVSTDPATAEGRGLVGVAFRTLNPAVSQDFLADERTQPWHEMARSAKLASGAAIPLLQDGKAVGVLVLYSTEKRSFDAEVLKLLDRMADNVSFALVNLGHEEERRRGQDRIAYLASHDALTGLPNRAMFGEMLNSAIRLGRRYERKFAVMFIDLDRFKHVNDSLGHAVGDELLKEMSIRFRACLRASDVVARMGGDEFVVLLHEADEPHDAALVARKLLAAALQPVRVAGQDCRVTASVGISLFPADAQDEPSLMKNADMAMYRAKAEGKNNYQFFTHDIRSQSLERLALESNLRTALENNEFTLNYQPKLDIQTDTITGVEALLRWTSPVLGAVSPGVFIPLAEETGLIVPIGRWVLRTACEQSAAWQRAGLPKVGMAVNLSARQFADDGLVEDLAQVLKDTGVDPASIELELTESMVISNAERAMKVLRRVKDLGVRLAIDDFGTGYSSLAQLKNFPVDTLKVDRSFIRDLPQNHNDRAITEAIISVGKSLCLNVVAEGVETPEQLDYLRANACDEMQGFYFSKPITADALADLLAKHSSAQQAAKEGPP